MAQKVGQPVRSLWHMSTLPLLDCLVYLYTDNFRDVMSVFKTPTMASLTWFCSTNKGNLNLVSAVVKDRPHTPRTTCTFIGNLRKRIRLMTGTVKLNYSSSDSQKKQVQLFLLILPTIPCLLNDLTFVS